MHFLVCAFGPRHDSLILEFDINLNFCIVKEEFSSEFMLEHFKYSVIAPLFMFELLNSCLFLFIFLVQLLERCLVVFKLKLQVFELAFVPGLDPAEI